MNVHLPHAPDNDEKVRLMREDAQYELDGVSAPELMMLSGVRESIRARPAPPTVPKVFLSNRCTFNCAYCTCRASEEKRTRYCMQPRELASLAVKQALQEKRGIFLTSAIFKNADYTQELIIETLRVIREELRFLGYVHAKVMPGADDELIRRAGRLSNRLSVNIEVARSEGYQMVAKNKSKENILTPMGRISELIAESKKERVRGGGNFATTQTTQMMAGATGEDDHQILLLSGALYKKYSLSRVYYTPFTYRRPATGYDDLPFTATPYWRMKRLYQADRLMQLYGFSADEIAPGNSPYLEQNLDPKIGWALRNLHLFPVEVNKADYEMLLRIPGIGVTYAKRIVEARKRCALTHDSLKLLGVSLKRSKHFITCGGRYQGDGCEDGASLRAVLSDTSDAWKEDAWQVTLDC